MPGAVAKEARLAFLRFLIWTSASVAFGIFLGGADIGGRSPLQHLQRLWGQHAPSISLKGVLEQAKAGATA